MKSFFIKNIKPMLVCKFCHQLIKYNPDLILFTKKFESFLYYTETRHEEMRKCSMEIS